MRIPIFIVPKRELTLVFFTEIVSKESSGEFIIGLPPKLHAILPLIGTDVKHSNWVPWVGTNVIFFPAMHVKAILLTVKFVIVKSTVAVSPSLSGIILIIVLFPSTDTISNWIFPNFGGPGSFPLGLTLYVSWVDETVIWPNNSHGDVVGKLSDAEHCILVPSLDNWSGLFDIHVKS